MKSNKISMKEIARLSGVSIATVSRIINENGRYSDETRQRVMDIIDKYQYETNSIAKSLRMNRSQTIGVLVPDINNEFFSVIVQEIESFFFDLGYSTIICNTAKSAEKEKEYLKILDSKMVDGLVCISGQEEVLTDVLKRKVPIVCIDRRPKIDSNVAFIASDHYAGGFIATEELIRKGCRRILVLTKQQNLSSVNERLNGFSDAMLKHNLVLGKEQYVTIQSDHNNLDAAKQKVQQLIENKMKFDGIFATNDWLGLGALLALQENGIQVPGEVKIVGFDNDTISKYCNPPLTTINQDKAALASKACGILLEMIEGKTPKIEEHQLLPVNLVERQTT
ncbi:LacI family DNA-binding transcriptional regulator [Paenibacillus sp. TY11]|uniref:LacI family DNA-binding transcriptional regulator n=1 Tax=Paenibacillus sp. TY11 TaxID=3448633 RepID=UPI004039BCDA